MKEEWHSNKCRDPAIPEIGTWKGLFGAFQTVPKFPLRVTNGVRVDVSKHQWLVAIQR